MRGQAFLVFLKGYITGSISCITKKDHGWVFSLPLTHISRAHHYSTLNISETVQDKSSYNGILIRTYACRTEGYKFEWLGIVPTIEVMKLTTHWVVSFITSIVGTIPRAQFLVCTGKSEAKVTNNTIRFCSVVFGVSSSLAVIHSNHGRWWERDRAWSVSHCTPPRTTYRALCWWSDTRIPTVNKKPAAKCDIQTTVQQLLIAKTDIRWESTF